jgi:hypothetical protein
MTGNAESPPPLMEPNVATMHEFMERIFGGDRLDGLHNGLIEVAYTSPTGQIDRAQHFGTDELDHAVEFAARVNRISGTNVYVGMALRRPDIKLHHRTGKANLLGVTALWVDWDAPGAADAARERSAFCRPNAVTVTGRKPHKRAQGLWLTTEAMTDVGEIEAALKNIQVALGGDPAVVDASRVMRLPGSIAWPKKEGRVVEMTELVANFDDRPRVYPTEQLLRVFKPKSAGGEAPDQPEPTKTDGAAGTADADPHAKNPFTGQFDPQALLKAIRPGNWYLPVRDFIAHMVGRGQRDWVILKLLEPYCDPDHQGLRPETMIVQTRQKYGRPEPDFTAEFDLAGSGAAGGESALDVEPLATPDLGPDHIPMRQWLAKYLLLLGNTTMLVAPGGQGKSTFTIQLGLSIAAGRSWGPLNVARGGGAVWIWNNEDDIDELNRRIYAASKTMGIPLKDVVGRFYRNSGAEKRLMVAGPGPNGTLVRMPVVDDLIQHIKARDIRLLVVDPFVATHSLNENDNVHMEFVAGIWREIAKAAGCAVLIVHHTSKPPQGDSGGHVGNQHSARGASALMAAARVGVTLMPMSDNDAERLFGKRNDDRKTRMVRLDSAKANLSAPSDRAIWFEKQGVDIGNGAGMLAGDEVGVLVWRDMTEWQNAAARNAQDEDDALKEMVADIMTPVAPGDTAALAEIRGRIYELHGARFGGINTLEKRLAEFVETGFQAKGYWFSLTRAGGYAKAARFIRKDELPHPSAPIQDADRQ